MSSSTGRLRHSDMTELNRDSVIRFLAERGGRAPNQELVDHFRKLLTEPPPGDARRNARQVFKDIVNELGSVRTEGDGVKYVCLRKRYRDEQGSGNPGGGKEPKTGGAPLPGQEHRATGDGHEVSGQAPRDTGEPPSAEHRPPPPLPPPPPPPIISVTEAPPGSPEEEHEPDSGAELLCPASPGISLPGGRTPRESRRGLRDPGPVSPQLRRGGGLLRAGGLRDSDSSSSVSGNEEEEGGGSVSGGSAALDPLEHAWMLSSCRARWDSLRDMLSAEPGLIPRRDFITGFSCLHWAAKHGQHELLVSLLGHARQHRVPVNINARAAGGYTALHLAAMHGHLDVMKLLVGAYDADVEIRDYSGRKAWQYLRPDTARDVQGLVGAVPSGGEEGEGEEEGSAGSGRWRLSRVLLPPQLIVHRLSQLPPGDEQDGPGGRSSISRKGSGSGRGKPRLNKIRFRTQIIHSSPSAPRDPDEEEGRPLKSPLKHRPKSNVFG
ncbi:ankyrin repeat domain-containing protein SOWAHC [Ascaphus truei]|uniref:ankyrin repeat domain-containing protein SOWAHC n=1 Tax=Ascaphus truei TaxID=8439 RepID=UPI003F59757E